MPGVKKPFVVKQLPKYQPVQLHGIDVDMIHEDDQLGTAKLVNLTKRERRRTRPIMGRMKHDTAVAAQELGKEEKRRAELLKRQSDKYTARLRRIKAVQVACSVLNMRHADSTQPSYARRYSQGSVDREADSVMASSRPEAVRARRAGELLQQEQQHRDDLIRRNASRISALAKRRTSTQRRPSLLPPLVTPRESPRADSPAVHPDLRFTPGAAMKVPIGKMHWVPESVTERHLQDKAVRRVSRTRGLPKSRVDVIVTEAMKKGSVLLSGATWKKRIEQMASVSQTH